MGNCCKCLYTDMKTVHSSRTVSLGNVSPRSSSPRTSYRSYPATVIASPKPKRKSPSVCPFTRPSSGSLDGVSNSRNEKPVCSSVEDSDEYPWIEGSPPDQASSLSPTLSWTSSFDPLRPEVLLVSRQQGDLPMSMAPDPRRVRVRPPI